MIDDGALLRRAVTLGRRDERQGPRRGAERAGRRRAGARRALRQPARRRQGGGGGRQAAQPEVAASGAGAAVALTPAVQLQAAVHVDHPRLDPQPGLRHHGDGGAVRAGPLFVCAAGRRADARRQPARRRGSTCSIRAPRPRRWSARSASRSRRRSTAIAGVKRITSRSFEGRGQMGVEFTLDADMNRAMQEVRDRSRWCSRGSRATPSRRRSRASTTTTRSRWW